MSKKKLVLIELNEINLDYVKEYIKVEKLPNLKKILNGNIRETSSEATYGELEPWIQWVSVHTGKSLAEHKVFRLGDIVNTNLNQIFEKVESDGFKVGCISPMNASNNLKNPSYFIPDPWTQTKSDDSFWSTKLSAVIQQVVNDNAQSKVAFKSLVYLALGLLRFARFKNYLKYLKFALAASPKPWAKAMFLDLFLHDVHWTLLKKNKPNFSTFFINAGAHIQHHYLFNAKVFKEPNGLKNPDWYISDKSDPLLELLKLYDEIIGEYLQCGYDLIIATGLSQIPFTKEQYYWRIKNHAAFLNKLNVKFKSVFPRMTRDFLIEFYSEEEASAAENILKDVVSSNDNIKLFEEIDNRKKSLFVTLTYSKNLPDEFIIQSNKVEFNINNDLAFVAIKNGMHSPKGYLFTYGDFENDFKNGSHVKGIYNLINNYFSR